MNSPRSSRIRLSGTESNPLRLVWLYHHTSIVIARSYPCISAFDRCVLVQTQRRAALGQISSRTPHQPQPQPLPQIPSRTLPQSQNRLMPVPAQLAQSLQYVRSLLPLENQRACLPGLLGGGARQVDRFHDHHQVWRRNLHGHYRPDSRRQRFPTLMQYHYSI